MNSSATTTKKSLNYMGSLIIYLKIKKNLIRYSACVAHRKSQSVQSIHLIKVLGGIDIHVWIKTQTQTGTFWIATQIGQEPVLSQNCLPSWRTWWLHDTENNHQFRVLLEVSNLLHCRQKKNMKFRFHFFTQSQSLRVIITEIFFFTNDFAIKG